MTIGLEASLAFTEKKAGPENYYHQIIKHILSSNSKHTFRIYAKSNAKINFGDKSMIKNYRVIRIPWRRLWTQGGLALECLLHPPQLLFIPAHTMPVIRRLNLKTVVTIHDLGAQYLPNYHKFPHKYYLNASTEYAAKHATHLIAISKATKQDLVDRLGVDPQRITVIYEGYNEALYKRPSTTVIAKTLKKYKVDKPYFLFIGTIQPRKNLVRVLEAYAQLKKSKDIKTIPQFVLIGQKGWLSDEIYATPKRLGIEDSVKFLGYVPDEDLPSFYSGAESFVYPSLFEGFGLPILEAFACECPVITSTVSSMPEVAGDAAILVDPNNTAQITKALTEVVTNKAKMKKLIVKGSVQVKKFSWEKAAKETLELFEKVANNKI